MPTIPTDPSTPLPGSDAAGTGPTTPARDLKEQARDATNERDMGGIPSTADSALSPSLSGSADITSDAPMDRGPRLPGSDASDGPPPTSAGSAGLPGSPASSASTSSASSGSSASGSPSSTLPMSASPASASTSPASASNPSAQQASAGASADAAGRPSTPPHDPPSGPEARGASHDDGLLDSIGKAITSPVRDEPEDVPDALAPDQPAPSPHGTPRV